MDRNPALVVGYKTNAEPKPHPAEMGSISIFLEKSADDEAGRRRQMVQT